MERTDFEQWKAREVARLLALVETERRYYQEMVALLPVALVVLSADRSVISANRAFRQTFGMRSEDLRRKTIEQIIPSARLIERIRDAHVHGIPQPDLYVEVSSETGDRTLRIAIVPIRNWDDESELETLLMVEDLRAIEGMLARVGLPAAALEPSGPPAASEIEVEPPESAPAPPVPPLADTSLPAVLWRANAATFQFIEVGGDAERLLGFPASHWLESPGFFGERIHPGDRAAAMAFYQDAAAQSGDASAEYRAISAAGDIVWCRETIRVSDPAENETADEPRSITGVVTDITVRKQLEEQALTAGRHDALRGLGSRLAHDLNNPLMIITGYAEETLETFPPEDPRREDIGQILDATERISGIAGQLLGVTRRLAVPPQPVEFGAFIASIEEKLVHAAGDGVTVAVSGADAVWALADPAQLEEIVLAMLSSARGDPPERSRVTIDWEIADIREQLPVATLKPGLYARLVLHDNGPGADAAQRVTVFESVLTGKDPGKAAGPGLARAYAIVREWEGDIAFASEPLRGSMFTIYLPYAPPEPAPFEAEEAGEPGADSESPVEPAIELAPEPVEPPRETILLVEDEAGIRALVRKILRRERYQVLEAGSGEDALTIAQSHEGVIHLLVTDVILPGIGGRDVAEGLKQSRPGLRVVYISGYTDDEGVRAGWFPPGSRFLQKPFTLSALVGKVREALDDE